MIDWIFRKLGSWGFSFGRWAENKNKKRVIKKLEKKQVPKKNLPKEDVFKQPSINEKILRIAGLEIGVKEMNGPENSDRVMRYHLASSIDNDVEHPDSVPWCSSFICFVIEKAGLRSTNSLMARSWEYWGESSMHDPAPGDIVVFWRKTQKSGFGHVGVFVRKNPDGNVVCLGGNQKDEVNISIFNPAKIVDIRRASHKDPLDREDMVKLNLLASSIINGETLDVASRVV